MTKRTTGDDASSALPVPAGDAWGSMDDGAVRLVEKARSEGVTLAGDGGLLTDLMRYVLQRGREVELSEHLGYERHAVEGRGSGNSRNGSRPKSVMSKCCCRGIGRGRSSRTVRNHQRRLDGLTGDVSSLSVKGMATGDIQGRLAAIYDTGISGESISKITRSPTSWWMIARSARVPWNYSSMVHVVPNGGQRTLRGGPVARVRADGRSPAGAMLKSAPVAALGAAEVSARLATELLFRSGTAVVEVP